MEKQKKTANLIIEIIMISASLVVLIPLLIMLLGSFKDSVEAARFNISLPSQWHFENYLFVIEKGGVIRAMLNSLLITSMSVGFGVVFASMAAYILARRSTKGSTRMYNYFLIGMIAPVQIITTYAVLHIFNLVGSYGGLILVYIGINLPFHIFLFTSFIKGVPRDLDEAAMIDGCGIMRTFFSIIFPLLKPVIATSVVMFAMGVWNDFQLPLYFLNSPKKWTMPLTVYNFYGRYFSNWNYVFADMVLTALPIVIVYLFAQKHIVAGMTSGAVKG